MKTIQSQTIIITDNNQTAKAYIDFCDKSLYVSVVSNNKQFDFGIDENLLKMLAYGYKLNCEKYDNEKGDKP